MSLFNLYIFSKKRFNTPTDHFTLISCATNISEVITKHRKRDIAHKNYQNDLNHSLNNSNFSGAANSAKIHQMKNRALKGYRKISTSPFLHHFK